METAEASLERLRWRLSCGPSRSWSFWFGCLLFAVPAAAGASEAAIRMLWDNWDPRSVPLDLRLIGMTVALGLWAAGVVAALFLLEQTWVLGTLTDENSGKLFGVCVTIGSWLVSR